VTYIYSLRDPNTYECRYVGQTGKSPILRLEEHLKDVSLSHKSHWIQKLVSNEQRPILEILEITDDWSKAERWWISEMKRRGENLTNATNGGEGVSGIVFSQKELERRSLAAKSRVFLKKLEKKLDLIIFDVMMVLEKIILKKYGGNYFQILLGLGLLLGARSNSCGYVRARGLGRSVAGGSNMPPAI
jgi:hypothetical protein